MMSVVDLAFIIIEMLFPSGDQSRSNTSQVDEKLKLSTTVRSEVFQTYIVLLCNVAYLVPSGLNLLLITSPVVEYLSSNWKLPPV